MPAIDSSAPSAGLLASEDRLAVWPLRLTLVLLLLRLDGPWPVRVGITFAAALGLLIPRLWSSRLLWLSLTALLTIRLVADWPLPDNHIYLLAYWCLAIALSLWAHDPVRTRAGAARLLVGLCFCLALLWKAWLAPEFRDQRFFRVTFQTDPRFAPAVLWLTGLDREDLGASRQALLPPPPGAEPLDWPGVLEPPVLRRAATVLTWVTLSIEGVIAALFLLPLPSRLHWLRHAALLVFCLTTYALAPVTGFGWLLLILGLAQLDGSRGWRLAYGCGFVAILLFGEIPWQRLAGS